MLRLFESLNDGHRLPVVSSTRYRPLSDCKIGQSGNPVGQGLTPDKWSRSAGSDPDRPEHFYWNHDEDRQQHRADSNHCYDICATVNHSLGHGIHIARAESTEVAGSKPFILVALAQNYRHATMNRFHERVRPRREYRV